MTGLVLIDAAIGVILALIVYSLVASAVQEAIANVFNLRGKMLVGALRNFFLSPDGRTGGEALVARIMEHPLIRPLKGPPMVGSTRSRAPSAIPPHLFARAAVETVAAAARDGQIDERELAAFLGALPLAPGTRKALATNAAGLAENVAAVENAVAETYDALMERVRGWYLRRVRFILFLIGFALAALTNFDVLGYGLALLRDDAARAAAVARAELVAGNDVLGRRIVELAAEAGAADGNGTEAFARTLDALTGEIAAEGLPVGWECRDEAGRPTGISLGCVARDFPRNVLAWVVVAFGCMLGAQVWFDALKRLLAGRADLSGALGGTRAPESRPKASDPGGSGG